MASQTQIVNLALTKLGQGRITAITDDSKAARAMNAVYDLEKLAELRKYRWSFALKRATLPALSTAPAWGFNYAYQLPSDYVSLIQVNDYFSVPALSDYVNSDDSLWSVESGQIFTDLGAPLKIRYIRNVTDEGDFDPLFVQSFAAHLAYVTCEEITGSNQKRDAAAADYKQCIKDALRVNGIERPPMSTADDSWMMGRL